MNARNDAPTRMDLTSAFLDLTIALEAWVTRWAAT